MSSIVLPSRGQCIQITDNGQPCQCQWFFPPQSPLLDQLVCGLCGHGIHAHADYMSIIVNHYPTNHCAAYAQTTHLTQRCTCEAQLYRHIATDNLYRLPEPWTVLDYFNPYSNGPSLGATTSNNVNSPFFPNTTSSSNYSTSILYRDATSIPFTPTYMPSTSPNTDPSYLYDDAIEAHSQSGTENSYGAQYQDDNFNVNVQDSRARFHRDYPYNAAHGAEAWVNLIR